MVENRRFQPRKTEIKRVFAAGATAGKGDCLAIAGSRDRLNNRAAGVAEAEQFGHLVKGLAGSVVDGATDNFNLFKAAAGKEGGMPAGNHQTNGGKLDLAAAERIGINMGLDMVDANQGQGGRPCNPLGKGYPGQQGADQAGTAGNRNTVEVVDPDFGLLY